MALQALSDIFGDRIISSGIWPAFSLALNPYDFFLLGLFEEHNYNSNLPTEELRENIHRENANIIAEQLQRANQNLFCHQYEEFLHVEGQHFQHLL
jgi:hypothetical protein